MTWVYMIACENGSYYTGSAMNIVKRYWQHINGYAKAKYTTAFKPSALACCWQVMGTKGDSLRLESYIKKRGRLFKEQIVASPELLKPIAKELYGINIEPFSAASVEEYVSLYTKSNSAQNFDPIEIALHF